MNDDFERKSGADTKRTVFLGIILVLFGLILGVVAFATLIGPIIGVLIVGLGGYLLWKSTQTGAPM